MQKQMSLCRIYLNLIACAQLDGTETRGSVYVIAATNRPDIIDAAMLRPGKDPNRLPC